MDIWVLVLKIGISALVSVALLFLARNFFYLYQASGYRLKAYGALVCKQYRVLVTNLIASIALFGIAKLVLVLTPTRYWAYLTIALFLFACIVLAKINKRREAKTPLVKTNRVKRLFVVFTLCAFAVCLGLMFVFYQTILEHSLLKFTPLLLPLIVALAGIIILPFELANNNRYVRRAKKRVRALQQPNPANSQGLKVIGITGSFGKTSVKFVLSHILSAKYKTVPSPSSYNTPLGLTKVILNKLEPDTEIFVAEMGAKRRWDIDTLCKIANPDIAIITAVGNQHLDTFKTLDTIKKTKYELVDYVSKRVKTERQVSAGQVGKCEMQENKLKGPTVFEANNAANQQNAQYSTTHSSINLRFAAFNLDNEVAKAYYGKTDIEKLGSSTLPLVQSFVVAKDIVTSKDGSTFTLHFKDSGESIFCTTVLLGRHNISNIVLCAGVAHKLGVSLQEIAKQIATLAPVKHRLELIRSGGITVIDDSFNASVEGVVAALEVLKSFSDTLEGSSYSKFFKAQAKLVARENKSGVRKIVITPGLIELGEFEKEENYIFGVRIASAADLVFLIGRNAETIKAGLLSKGFNETNILTFKTLAKALEKYGQVSREGDVVLFSNDLPDALE
ncbi:MAG: UDP-N-acetylmuramoyl-tripeptide--D-alanyl-D-alanine ligase [Firmicutes bacterium]|nr:UDP-N-acetylmuramoyl-tripeptide--D-alanyl-D-alanine ligase [Bacillota bacterium]